MYSFNETIYYFFKLIPPQNYLAYAPASSLFTNIAPGHLSSGGNLGSAPGLMTAPLMVGTHHSPDLIGIPSSAYVATSSATAHCQNAVTGILAPAIVIGSKASGCPLPGSSAISKYFRQYPYIDLHFNTILFSRHNGSHNLTGPIYKRAYHQRRLYSKCWRYGSAAASEKHTHATVLFGRRVSGTSTKATSFTPCNSFVGSWVGFLVCKRHFDSSSNKAAHAAFL